VPESAPRRFLDQHVLALGREMRLSFLPPLMVYMAAGISGLTAVVGTFFVKEYLGLSAEFLAGLAFWAGLPWVLKMPLGHLVDLIWKYKGGLVYLGAALLAGSLAIMIGLLSDPDAMRAVMPVEAWYVLSFLLGPVGYVLQDVVADAMTVEAVPRFDETGAAIGEDVRRRMHTTMQTLGRVAIISGSFLVAGVNVYVLSGTEGLPPAEMARVYRFIYELALAIPLISMSGVLFAGAIRRRDARRLAARGISAERIGAMLDAHPERPPVNWWILGGGLVFAAVSLGVGFGALPYGQEIVFASSMAIVLFLMRRLVAELEPAARRTLVGTAVVIFVFRATPSAGPGAQWWMIDGLGFDPAFFARLQLISTGLTLAGLFGFRTLMAERSIVYIVSLLTIAGTILALPIVGMYYGLHEWTAALTGGLVDARVIALVDTALESPLGQIAMVPMLAWVARSAPDRLKATYFAVMASFTNLALSAAQLGTKYLNQIFSVTREVKDATGAVTVPADYSELGVLLLTATAIAFLVPFAAIAIVRALRLGSD
jgi:hypothetical protein